MITTDHSGIAALDKRKPTNQHLQEVALAQFTFKGDKLRAVGVAIAAAALESASATVWADEVPLPPLGEADRNLVGTAWKNLARWGILQRLEGAGDHRRSKREGRRGGLVFRYRLLSSGLAKAFLKANAAPVPAPKLPTQQELI